MSHQFRAWFISFTAYYTYFLFFRTSILHSEVDDNQHQLWEKASNQEIYEMNQRLEARDLEFQESMNYK